MKRKGIRIRNGQIWKIGKGTVKLVSERNKGIIVSDTVVIVTFHGAGLIGVQCFNTGITFDITSHSLTTLLG